MLYPQCVFDMSPNFIVLYSKRILRLVQSLSVLSHIICCEHFGIVTHRLLWTLPIDVKGVWWKWRWDIPPYLNNILLKQAKQITPVHSCGQLSVYPGLKMHCYLRVCTPSPPITVILIGGPGRGDQKLTWCEGTQTTVCLHCSKWSYDKDKHSSVVRNNMLYFVSSLIVFILLISTMRGEKMQKKNIKRYQFSYWYLRWYKWADWRY